MGRNLSKELELRVGQIAIEQCKRLDEPSDEDAKVIGRVILTELHKFFTEDLDGSGNSNITEYP